MQTLTFLGFWLANSAILWIIGQLVPENVVLGNQHVSAIQAGLFAGFLLATVNILIEPTIGLLKLKLASKQHWATVLVLVNSLSIWIITRLALIVGVGVTAAWWVVVLGLAATLGQWFVWRLTRT